MLLLGACGSTSLGETETVRDELNPINDSFMVDKHEEYANLLQEEHGASKEEADERTFELQLRDVALINKATEVGIDVSDEKALERAEEDRATLESEEGRNSELVLDKINELINELNITEEEYWTDYVLNDNKMKIMQEKLQEHELKENAQMDWNERSTEIMKEFKENEAEQIKEFKREIDMD